MTERMKVAEEKRCLYLTLSQTLYINFSLLFHFSFFHFSHFNYLYSSLPSSLFLPLPVCASRWTCDPVSFCARRTKEPFEVQELPRGRGRIWRWHTFYFLLLSFFLSVWGPGQNEVVFNLLCWPNSLITVQYFFIYHPCFLLFPSAVELFTFLCFRYICNYLMIEFKFIQAQKQGTETKKGKKGCGKEKKEGMENQRHVEEYGRHEERRCVCACVCCRSVCQPGS